MSDDLPPTDAEVMAHPKVKALVEALNQYQLAAAGFVSVQSARDKADAVLAAIQEAKP